VTGRWHFSVTIEDQLITVDYREPCVAEAVRRVQQGLAWPDDEAVIWKWWLSNAIQSENCRRGLCAHEVV